MNKRKDLALRAVKVAVILIAYHLSLAVSFAQTPMKFRDGNLPIDERVEDLLNRLTLEEKVKLMMNSSPAIKRLGIAQFNWWSEALHGVGRNGVSTVFPSCIGMACSFDEELVERIYTAVSDEARAKYNALLRSGNAMRQYQGLSFWTPNINIFRDPRWGRGQETYGEDPLLNAQMGLRVVRGLQGKTAGSAFYKLLACAKHFAVHSGPEKLRHKMNVEQLSQRDLYETYLPAFKRLVQEGDVQEVMCAYQRFEGDPCCGSNRLLQHILREEWGFKGLVVSDCGAINDFYMPDRHGVSADAPAASAKGVLSGTDVECGRIYNNLPQAIQRGDIKEEDLDVSVRRLLKGRFLLGEFDDDSRVPWSNIPTSVIASEQHKQLALQMAREQMVLLKNNGILPLVNLAPSKGGMAAPSTSQTASSGAEGRSIMVMGPNAADSTMLWGIYFGQPSHTVTPLEGIRNKIGEVKYTPACGITTWKTAQMVVKGQTESADGSTTLVLEQTGEHEYSASEVLQAASGCDTIIFVGGISPNLEKEQARVNAEGFDGGDRTTIELPRVQRELLKALHDAGKKIIFVCCSGSAVALSPEMDTCDAIIQAWYAGEQGGNALADVIFGLYNPSGKLSVTFYKDDSQLPPFDDYRMAPYPSSGEGQGAGLGRTYRFFRGEPLFPFGYGLSYTTFTTSKPKAMQSLDGQTVTVSVDVKNTGAMAGTEIVQVYMRRPADAAAPLKTLCGYARVELQPGESKKTDITLPVQRFECWDAATNAMRVLPGDYELMVGTSSADKDLKKTKLNIKL